METILVVDDEAPVRALARDILLGAGYRVLEAEDGEQALRVAEEHRGPSTQSSPTS
jgi:CheY-like chemotaxis protein